MSLWDTVEFAHVALRLVPKVLNPVDVVLLVCNEFGVVDSKVLEVRNIQYVVGFPAVPINSAVMDYISFDNSDHSFLGRIYNNLRVDPSPSYQQAKYRGFPGCAPSAFPLTVASKITFIHLDFTTKHGFVFSFQLQSDNLA